MIAQLFCKHKFKSIRKTENETKQMVMPNVEHNQTFQFVKNAPVEFYTVKKTTEVFCCEKCGKFSVIHY